MPTPNQTQVRICATTKIRVDMLVMASTQCKSKTLFCLGFHKTKKHHARLRRASHNRKRVLQDSIFSAGRPSQESSTADQSKQPLPDASQLSLKCRWPGQASSIMVATMHANNWTQCRMSDSRMSAAKTAAVLQHLIELGHLHQPQQPQCPREADLGK